MRQSWPHSEEVLHSWLRLGQASHEHFAQLVCLPLMGTGILSLLPAGGSQWSNGVSLTWTVSAALCDSFLSASLCRQQAEACEGQGKPAEQLP